MQPDSASRPPFDPATSEAPGYSIAVASRRSGVRQDTIRAWERRHQALHPVRTEGGHRLYSDADVERLRLLRLATDAGHRIGHIAALDDAALVVLVQADARHARADARSAAASTGGATGGGASTRDTTNGDLAAVSPPAAAEPDPRLADCLRAIDALDERALVRELEEASVHLPRALLVDRLLAPLVEAVGAGYDQGRLRPAHEHLAAAAIASFAQTFRAAFAVPPSAPSLIVATPVHQHHELGAVLAGAVAAAEGWQVVHLGPNLPAEDIAAAAHWKNATAVALSLVFPPDDRLLIDEIRRLRRLLDRRITLVVGGGAAGAYRAVLAEVGAAQVEDFATFRRLLGELRAARAASELAVADRAADRAADRR